MTRVTLLAGGVGGAKLAEGFVALAGVDLTILGNVADDDEFHGLWVSPDIDTMIYTLSGRIDRAQGWGRADEGRRALDTLADLGAETWMFLGDRDFGLHIYRTHRLRSGERRSQIVAHVARQFDVPAQIVLPTDDRVQTRVRTPAGWQSFQEYFVRDRCAPKILDLAYEGLQHARMTPEARMSIAQADVLVIAPSNPLASIAPILEIPGIRAALSAASAPIVGVSPLIAGQAVKGPADCMMRALGHQADALGVARLYEGLVTDFLIDTKDRALAGPIAALAIAPHCTDTYMGKIEDKARLAREVLAVASARREGV